MNLVAFNTTSLPVGRPLPFALRNAQGTLMAARGYVIRSPEEVQALVARETQLYVDTNETPETHRRYVDQLQHLLWSDPPLGDIATMRIAAPAYRPPPPRPSGPPDWYDLQQRAARLLRLPQQRGFPDALGTLALELAQLRHHAPDATLLALIYLSGQQPHLYSATHAMLVACVGMVAAQQTLQWPDAQVLQLGCAALSMNVAMTRLQDSLTRQAQALTERQLHTVHGHAEQSELLLREHGVTDTLWLEAVRHHHQRARGPLSAQSPGQQTARLIQRADVLGARLAPRATRPALPATAALQACYYDDERQVDEAGAALLRTLGVYPPGTFVRLASDEVAVVLRRGLSATTPHVAVVVGRSGLPTGEPIPRRTAQPAYRITAPLAPHQVKVRVPLRRLLDLATHSG